MGCQLSQKVAIVEGNTYTLTLLSDRDRSIVVGIGLSERLGQYHECLEIGASRTKYSFTYSQVGFEASDARVLFDIGGSRSGKHRQCVFGLRG